LITHDHYDHLEEPTIKKLDSKTGLFLVPLGIGELLEDWGIAPEKVAEACWSPYTGPPSTWPCTPGTNPLNGRWHRPKKKRFILLPPLIGEQVDINRLPDKASWWRKVYHGKKNAGKTD
jgi:hypothetical protein